MNRYNIGHYGARRTKTLMFLKYETLFRYLWAIDPFLEETVEKLYSRDYVYSFMPHVMIYYFKNQHMIRESLVILLKEMTHGLKKDPALLKEIKDYLHLDFIKQRIELPKDDADISLFQSKPDDVLNSKTLYYLFKANVQQETVDELLIGTQKILEMIENSHSKVINEDHLFLWCLD